MSYQLSFSIYSSTCSLGNWRAQLVNSSGANYGSIVASGFVDLLGGAFLSTLTLPDAFQGGCRWYDNTAPSGTLAWAAINPGDQVGTNSFPPVIGTTSTTISLGPALSKPDGMGGRSAIPNVTVDVYQLVGTAPAVGAGTYTGTTDSNGMVSITFDSGLSSSSWVARFTYPAGKYDTSRPTYVYTEITPLIPDN